MKTLTRDDVLLIFVMFIWGSTTVAIKLVLREFDPLAFSALRAGIAAIFLLSVLFATDHKWGVRRVDILRLALIGATGVSVNQLAYVVGLQHTLAANVAIIGSTTSPIFGLLFARLLEDERAGRRQWLGVMTAMLGVGLLIVGRENVLHVDLNSLSGDLLILGSSASFALCTVLVKPMSKIYSPLQVTTYTYAAGAILLLPFASLSLLAQSWAAVSPGGWALALYASLILGGTWILWYGLVGRVGVTRSLVFLYLQPVFGVLLAVLVLSETLTGLQMLGALAALVGVYIARRS